MDTAVHYDNYMSPTEAIEFGLIDSVATNRNQVSDRTLRDRNDESDSTAEDSIENIVPPGMNTQNTS